jgi:hypothetical protein
MEKMVNARMAKLIRGWRRARRRNRALNRNIRAAMDDPGFEEQVCL